MKRITLVFLMIAISILTLAGCGNKSVSNPETIRNVKVTEAKSGPISVNVQYGAKLKPQEEITVVSKLPGKVEKIYADVGKTVKKGDLLFTLERKDAQAQYDQANAAYEGALANLKRTGDSGVEQLVLQAQTALDQAQIQYDDASRMFSKVKSLYENGAANKTDYDGADSRLKAAKIQYETAKNNLDLLKQKSAPQSVDLASAQVSQAEAAMTLAKNQLDNLAVTSPVDGVVSARNIDESELISSSIPAFTIINAKSFEAEISVPDNVALSLTKGQILDIVANTTKDVFKGTIEYISPNVDLRTQLYTIKIRIDNPYKLISGMFVKILVPSQTKNETIIIPNEAISMQNNIQYVYTVENGTVKKKIISTGITNEKITEVTHGLKVSEKVIVEGQNFLSEGDRVNIVK